MECWDHMNRTPVRFDCAARGPDGVVDVEGEEITAA
jgi:hypothetical protein